MNAERARAFLHSLPHVVETVQWGDNLVFWVGDEAIGGKMFALVDLTRPTRVISYAAGPEHYADLVEQVGFLPAPYMARLFWISAETWAAHRDPVWEVELRAAHTLTYNKLPAKVRTILDLPARDKELLLQGRKELLASRGQAPPTTTRTMNLPPKTNSRRPKGAPPKQGRPTKASRATSLATAARAASPKKHRQH